MQIQVKNVSKKFKKNYVLKNINLDFQSGKIYLLSGQNGCGKSVLLKLICGLYLPTNGEILFDGKKYNSNSICYSGIRALIETPNFFPNLTGLENLKLLAKINDIITEDEIVHTLSKLNFKKFLNRKYCEYSLGMKQKLGIAQVLMENPKIIILDEPFNALDEKTNILIRKILIEEKEKDKIVILASHINIDFENFVDQVYYLDNGHIVKNRRNK